MALVQFIRTVTIAEAMNVFTDYFFSQMANNPSQDRTIEALLGKFDFYFAPVVNPDGYEYSRSHVRYRK